MDLVDVIDVGVLKDNGDSGAGAARDSQLLGGSPDLRGAGWWDGTDWRPQVPGVTESR